MNWSPIWPRQDPATRFREPAGSRQGSTDVGHSADLLSSPVEPPDSDQLSDARRDQRVDGVSGRHGAPDVTRGTSCAAAAGPKRPIKLVEQSTSKPIRIWASVSDPPHCPRVASSPQRSCAYGARQVSSQVQAAIMARASLFARASKRFSWPANGPAAVRWGCCGRRQLLYEDRVSMLLANLGPDDGLLSLRLLRRIIHRVTTIHFGCVCLMNLSS